VSKAQFKHYAFFITCVIIVSFVIISSFSVFTGKMPVDAAASSNRWYKVNIPAEGEAGGWALANGSDIRLLTAAADGTLYAYAAGLNYTLLKSTDGGLKWSSTGKVRDIITDIAVAADNPALIYYSTAVSVYRSGDGGRSFSLLPTVPGTGSGHVEITSLAAESGIIAAATRNTDSARYGGLYLLDESAIVPSWTDTGIGNYDVYAVAFPPDFAAYRQIVAITTNETESYIFSKISNSGWNTLTGRVRFSRDNSGAAVAITKSAGIAFPGDYSTVADGGERSFYACINSGTGNGDVYRVNLVEAPTESLATDLNTGGLNGNNTDITSLAVYKENDNTVILAGAANAQTYISTDSGASWTKNQKAPTGNTDAYVLFPPDFPATHKMYAATSGSGSALSISRDIGLTWNQVSLIDTSINRLVDLRASPDFSRDKTLFLDTFGAGPGSAALWRTLDGGLNWERLFSGSSPGVDIISSITLPPEYGTNCFKLFIAGESAGNPIIWSSEDNGQSFRTRFIHNPAGGDPFPVNALVAADKNTLFIASYDGSQGLIYRTVNGGFFYTPGVPAGNNPFASIALSPDYAKDGIILAGNSNGEVYQSHDGGASFQPLPSTTNTGTLTGSVTVAFDLAFKDNHNIYASSDTAGAGLFRFTTGESEEWLSIDSTLPSGGVIANFLLSRDGTLYAVNSNANGGMERCLDSRILNPVFETITGGLSTGAALRDIDRTGNRLWAIDTANCKLVTYEDTLTAPVIQTAPVNNISGIGSLIDHAIKNIIIDWEPVTGASGYQWQCAYNGDFSNIPAGLEGTVTGSEARLPPLDPSTMYSWRVRVNAPALGPWSEKRVFSTSLDTRVIELKPESPEAGAVEVPVKPVFQWTAVVGASSYELLVSDGTDFTHPVITKINDFSLPSNAWECDVPLDYDTTYYWKIRAISDGSHSPWSSAGVFITVSAPLPPSQPSKTLPEVRFLGKQDSAMNVAPPQNTPVLLPPAETPIFPPAAVTTVPAASPDVYQLSAVPVWLLYFIGGLLAIVMLALFIILAVVLKIKRF
jgi:photosystem II stability/assembly factor-like uncharacterized protein